MGEMDDWNGDQKLASASAFGNLPAEAGLFEADFRFFDFGRQATGLQQLLGLLDRSLRSIHIDILCFLRNLSHDGHFCRGDFGITPEDCHVVGLITHAIPEFTDA